MQWSAVFDDNFKEYPMLNVGVHKNGFSFPKEEHNDGNDEKDFIFMKGEMTMIHHGNNREETEKGRGFI